MKIIDLIISETKEFMNEVFDNEESLADRVFNKRYNQIPRTNKHTFNDPSMGELVGYIYKDHYKLLKEPIAVYKNPKSLINFGSDTRAVLTNNNDLYVATSYEALHTFMLDLLVTKGILPAGSIINYMEELPEEFIALRRAGDTNTFGLARYNSENFKMPRYYLMLFDNANSKFSFNFKVFEELNELIDPNYMMGNIPNQHLDGMGGYDPGIMY